jgi:hypothetical protein
MPEKKPRKKPKEPQKIDPAVWLAIKTAVCAGAGYSETARRFGVSVFAIMQKARRNHWPTGSRIEQRVKVLQEARYKAREHYKPYAQQRDSNDETVEAIAQSWSERAEAHRMLSFGLAHGALKEAAKSGLPALQNWRDISMADSVARRSAGLEDKAPEVLNIGLSLVNERLEMLSVSLPRDARALES